MLKGAGGVVEFLCGSMATAEGIEDAEKRQDFLLDDAEKCRACVYHLPRAGAARLAGGD